VALWSLPAAAAERPPHILFFLADDLGWNDVGYHGSEIRTPHIDALARSGVRLEQFYVEPTCTATRSALLTGRYPIRQGLQSDVVRPWSDWGLPESERTLPQALGEAGYQPLMVGKWHLGHARRGQLPRARGFQHHYGNYLGAINYFSHRRDGGLDWHRDGQPVEEPGYVTFLLANEAIRILRSHDPSTPLFLYVAFTAPHTPLQAPGAYRQRYRYLDDPDRQTFAAMVAAMDDAVGRIVAVLRERGLADDSLIVFASDNGGLESHGADNGPLRGGKTELYEGGVRVPAVAVWPGRLPKGAVVESPIHVTDWYPTLLRVAGARTEQPLPIDGRDVRSILMGEAPPLREFLYNLNRKAGAIRSGRWKLLRRGSKSELFDLAQDPAETRDLAGSHPETVRALGARLDAYAAEAVPALAREKPEGFQAPAVWGPTASGAQRPAAGR